MLPCAVEFILCVQKKLVTMTRRRVYDQEKHIHFVTFSCYKRRKHLQHDRAKRIVIGVMGSRLAQQDGLCLGFVVMPDHVHALVWFPEVMQLSPFMNKWKELTSKSLKQVLPQMFPKYWSTMDSADPIWQPKYYGVNIWSRDKLEEKLAYIHQNPVRAGLVQSATDWLWSSARWYVQHRSVGVPILWPPGMENDDDFVVA